MATPEGGQKKKQREHAFVFFHFHFYSALLYLQKSRRYMQRNQYNMRPLTAETVNEAIGRATFNPAYRHLHAVKDLGQVLRRHKIRIPTSVACFILSCARRYARDTLGGKMGADHHC